MTANSVNTSNDGTVVAGETVTGAIEAHGHNNRIKTTLVRHETYELAAIPPDRAKW